MGEKHQGHHGGIRLGVGDWGTSKAVAAVFRVLLEDVLDVDEPISDVSFPSSSAGYNALAEKAVDISLELWRDSARSEYDTFVIEKGSVVSDGKLGFLGRSGLFIRTSASAEAVLVAQGRFYSQVAQGTEPVLWA